MADLQFFKISEDKVLASRIVPLLKPLLLDEGAYVWLKGNTPDGIYMLVKGRVILMEEFPFSDQKSKLVGFKSMINGSYFGEIELIYRHKRDYYV